MTRTHYHKCFVFNKVCINQSVNECFFLKTFQTSIEFLKLVHVKKFIFRNQAKITAKQTQKAQTVKSSF